ncbi:cation transporting ATPase C-terminal domain-containing protein [Geodermatophilus poikilotrophus]|nr:cation-translocating P-type ATPase C-terminal domain-containing protein [Geodermatophilus poikilotrophus]
MTLGGFSACAATWSTGASPSGRVRFIVWLGEPATESPAGPAGRLPPAAAGRARRLHPHAGRTVGDALSVPPSSVHAGGSRTAGRRAALRRGSPACGTDPGTRCTPPPAPAHPDDGRGALTASRHSSEPPSLGAPLLREIGLRGTVTSAGALVAWLIARRIGTGRRASTVALATLVGAELGQTLLLSGRNPLVVATGLGSAGVLAAIIQLPGASRLFGCRPLGPLSWAVVLACSTAATVTSAALPRLFPALLTGEGPRTPAVPNREHDRGSVAA